MSAAPTIRRLAAGATLTTAGGRTLTLRYWQGEGSYAHVFRAALGPESFDCAFKLAKSWVSGAAARLERERQVLAAVRNPHVVGLLDCGWAGDQEYLVLEWLSGETLADELSRRRRLPLRLALEYLAQILDGLAAIHARGKTQGDLRAQNVLLTPERGAVLIDPGALPEGLEQPELDVRVAGLLFTRMLLGRSGPLTSADGFNAGAVALWAAMQSSSSPPAAELRDRCERLRARL